MTSEPSKSVFDTPGVSLLCELEDAALTAGAPLTALVQADGRLTLGPNQILTAERSARIKEHRQALLLLVRCVDDGVVERRAGFVEQIKRAAGVVAPALRFRACRGVTVGHCVSCNEPWSSPICWRCQLAARLALRGDVPADWRPAGEAVLEAVA